MPLSIAHSIDLDDDFMFWALATNKLNPGDWGFDEIRYAAADTETLNEWASQEKFDVAAVSIAHVPAIQENYLLLPHGGSLGRGYGPVIVAREAFTPADLAGRRVGIPGERTTAARLLAHAIPAAVPVVVPFYGGTDAIDAGTIDAAVLIHEGRLVYKKQGYRLVIDLGVWWDQETSSLPLPLGGNVIRRALGNDTIARASAMLCESIRYALEHRDRAIDELLTSKDGMSRSDADTYLALYANADTLDYGQDGRDAVRRLLDCEVSWSP